MKSRSKRRTPVSTPQPFRYHRLPLSLVRLEDRTVPSGAGFYPPSQFHYNTDLSAGADRAGDPLGIALDYLRGRTEQWGLTPADLAQPSLTSQYIDDDTGIYHGYLRQTAYGLPVVNADFSVAVAANGAVISIGGGFVADLEARLAGARVAGPILDPVAAIAHAATDLGLELEEPPVEEYPVNGPALSFTFTAPSLSIDPIVARLQYAPTEDGTAVLAWGFVLQTPDLEHWYDLSVDAMTGEIVALADWIDSHHYSAFHLPHESPQEGGSAVISKPADPTASPHGWHDTNGAAGAEFTDTRGNNVDAHLDRDANNIADASPGRPEGGSNLNFSGYIFDPAQEPGTLQNQNAAVVNLFHMNNLLHDVHYQYGFTEVAGNFQVNNYGKGGAGNDAVQADAQDGSGTNNANFGTPTDGNAPRMQMFIWTSQNPDRDSDLDNGVIIHEYGHGVSNRLTGGPANSSALNAVQSGGMGEGWSDYHALMLTQRPSDQQTAGYGIGTYLLGEPQNGDGIRRRPYSFDMNINPLTWDAFGTSGTTSYGITRSTAVHASGEIWASALWDMTWLLINKYGYDPNLTTGWSNASAQSRAGNKLAMRLVMDGMKLQPANPSFVQARDAILAADAALTGGANHFEIWTAFARRGLGVNAATSASSATTITVDTTMPMFVSGTSPANRDVVTTAPTSFVLNVTDAINAGTLQASDFKVNGQSASGVAYTAGDTSATFTFGASPVTVNGAQAISVAAGAFTRASDAAAVGAYTASFFFDPTPLSVTSITPANGATVQLPFDTVDVNFNQAVDLSSVLASDLSVSQGRVTNVTALNGNTTLRFTIADITGEGYFTAMLMEGAVSDLQAGPNARALATYTLDYGTVPFLTSLDSRSTRGSLIYDGITSGAISTLTDSDTFNIVLDAGSRATFVVDANTSLRPAVSIVGPGTNSSAIGDFGGEARVDGVAITTPGTYAVTVSGLSGSTGGYTIQVILNTADEVESTGGSNNDSLATAQPLDALLIDVGGLERTSIRGRTEGPTVAEVESNNSLGTATPIAIASSQPTNLYQFGYSGEITNGTDADYVNIGQLQVGDVLTIVEAASGSGRGTNTDPLVRLYRSGTTSIITSDDDSGPGIDSMIYRYTITTTDTYYVRAHRFNSSALGTYQIAVFLENTGAAPATGGTFTAEVEPNESRTGSNNASSAWMPVKYLLSASGTITAGDTDLFEYQFDAGDVVSFQARSTSDLNPAVALFDAGGTQLVQDPGTSATSGAGGFTPIYGYVIPTSGSYFFRVSGAASSTGSYTADVYRSTSATLPLLAPAKDLYSLALTGGEAVSLTINNLTTGGLNIAILDPAGVPVANSVAGATNLTEILANFVAPTTDTYYVEVTGDPNTEYQLGVQVGGTFDAEANDSFAAAQAMNRAALGAITTTDDWYRFSVTAGQVITLTTTTPGGGAGEFVNTLDPLIELYSPSNVLIASDDNSGADGRNAALAVTAGVTGEYRVRVRAAASTTGEYVVRAQVAAPTPAKIASVIIGDGTPQRSRVNQIVVQFDQVVSLPGNPADAFQLVRQGSGTPVALAATVSSGATTSATLTFTGGPVEFQSLADGRYTLTVLSSQVSNFDGNGDGTAGDDYTLAGTPANGLFRLFGDFDGNAFVDSTDFLAFRLTFLASSPIFDFDLSGLVDSDDLLAFRLRFLQTV